MRVDIRSYFRSLLALLGYLVVGCNDAVSPPGPTTGAVHVKVSTSGKRENLDHDGYALRLDAGPFQLIGLNDSSSIPNVANGSHQLQLAGVDLNCEVEGPNPQKVDVVDGTLTYAVVFSVRCFGTTGSLRVSTVTTGADPDPDGYTADVSGVGTVDLPVNGSRTLTGVRAGVIGISLNNVAGNCAVDNPRSPILQVVHDSISDVVFTVRCVSAGSLRITTVTKGVDADKNGYGFYLALEGAGPPSPYSEGANSTVTISNLLPGNYLLNPVDVAPNCTPVVASPMKVSVAVGDPTDLTVEVVCVAATPLALVTTYIGKSGIERINSNGTGASQLSYQSGTDQNPAW